MFHEADFGGVLDFILSCLTQLGNYDLLETYVPCTGDHAYLGWPNLDIAPPPPPFQALHQLRGWLV